MAQPIYKQVETIQLAPDALLFINGSDTVKDANGEVYEIRNDITDLSVDLDVSSSPGTASFSISLPDHSIRRFADRRYNVLRLMSEVEIYFKGRFPKTMVDGRLFYPYYPCFWGMITSLNENYSDGVHTISVSCADILRWWEMTNVAINPAVGATTNTQTEADKTNPDVKDQKKFNTVGTSETKDGVQIAPFGNIYANMLIPDIMLELARVSMKDLAPFKDFSTISVGTTDKIGADQIDKANNLEQQIMNYWVTRLGQIGRNLRIYGVTKDPVTGKLVLDNEQMQKAIPYMLDGGSPGTFQTATMSKLELANNCKDVLQYEFFMDVNGELIFKPPFYNMDVRSNLNSVIDDIDIINWGFTQAEAEVVTRMDVTGQFHEAISGTASDTLRGVAVDVRLAQQFGIRAQERHVTFLNTSEKCLEYAQAELIRMNCLVSQGSITIMGRPELRLGYPVYISARDCFYYIKGISHSFSFGGSFNTTLTLTGERKRKRHNDGQLIKNEYFRSVGELQDTSKTIEGNSIAEPTTSDNFLQQMTDLCIPNKKATNDQVVEPNFIASTEKTTAMVQGQWQSFSGVKLTNQNSKKEVQTTDEYGYEIIPFFNYSSSTELAPDSNIKSINQRRDAYAKASKANDLKPDDIFAKANPNNIGLTLDDEDASMLNLYDKTPETAARKAQDNGIKP